MTTATLRNTLVLGISALILSTGSLHAQNAKPYPTRAVNLVVPFAPGGATDILARQLGRHLSTETGQAFIVDNRAGAGGTVGARVAARSTPDGYTLVMGTNASHAIAATINKNLSYDPINDFEPITLVAHVPQVLMVHPSLPIDNVQDLIAYAKANPDSINFGSAGTGTPGHLGMELFKIMTDTEMTHIPFQGGGPGLMALAGGQVQIMADNVNSALPQIQSGSVKPIAVTSAQRSSALPDLPTIAEQGVPGFESGSWFALFAPKNTPAPIIEQLNRSVIEALSTPDVMATLTQQGAEPSSGTPTQLQELQQQDIKKWQAVVDQIGLSIN